jgi:hypothetical protein
MNKLALASIMLFASAAVSAQLNPAAQDWTGVWNITNPDRPGGSLNIANDAGPNGTTLSGTMVFYVNDRETGRRIAVEPRTMVAPHLEGNTLVFQVRNTLKPHLKGSPPASQEPFDPTDVADMILTPAGDGKATLTCPKCRGYTQLDLERQR